MGPGQRVRFSDGMVGEILAVAIGEYEWTTPAGTLRVTGFLGLLKLADGKLTTRALEAAELVDQAPVEMPIPGGGR